MLFFFFRPRGTFTKGRRRKRALESLTGGKSLTELNNLKGKRIQKHTHFIPQISRRRGARNIHLSTLFSHSSDPSRRSLARSMNIEYAKKAENITIWSGGIMAIALTIIKNISRKEVQGGYFLRWPKEKFCQFRNSVDHLISVDVTAFAFGVRTKSSSSLSSRPAIWVRLS